MAEQASVRVADALADRVRSRMEALGLNQFSLAKRAGLGESYVRDLFRGKVKEPGSVKLFALAAALGCEPKDLLPRNSVLSPLALRIQMRLKALGISARAASLKSGYGPDVIRTIFDGRTESPRGETVMALARALECSTSYLLGEEESPAPPAVNPDAITITRGESGMWLATRENDRPIFVGARTLEDLCAILPEAVRRKDIAGA